MPPLPAPLDRLPALLADGLGRGWLLDAVIALLLLEALALWLWHRRGGGPPARRWWPMLAAGLGLLLAWRAALSTDVATWSLAALAAAGLAHARDLWLRLRPDRG